MRIVVIQTNARRLKLASTHLTGDAQFGRCSKRGIGALDTYGVWTLGDGASRREGHTMNHSERTGFRLASRALAGVAACVVAGVVRVSPGNPGSSPTPAPAFPDTNACYHLPFANTKPVDFEHLQSLSVRISVNGGPPIRVQVDTGSTGVVLGVDDVPNADSNGPAGSITYSSSGIELLGRWTNATITFPDAVDAQGHVPTAEVPVLAVTERKVHEGAVNSGAKPAKNPRVRMLGIGNGRGKANRQDLNPWVNLKEMKAGTMRRGYMITRSGITLGLTKDSVGTGFLFEKLVERVNPADEKPAPEIAAASKGALPVKDWDSALGWVTIAGEKSPTSRMLLDTGLTNMMVQWPEAKEHSDVPEGTEVTLHLLSGRLSYSFKVGDTTNPTTPRKVTRVKSTSRPLVNTGLRALALFDYLYDADGGYFGLRPVKSEK